MEPQYLYINSLINFKPSRREIIYIRAGKRGESVLDRIIGQNYFTIEGMFRDRNTEFCDITRFNRQIVTSSNLTLNPNILKTIFSQDKREQGLLQYIGEELVDGDGKHKFLFYPIDDNSDIWNEFLYFRDNVMHPYTTNIQRGTIPVSAITPEERALLAELYQHFDISSSIGSLKYQLSKYKKAGQVVEMPSVSPMLIDKNGVIRFTQYGTSVKLQPTQLAIYMHYLRHPEGIKRYKLDNYVDELADIYLLIKPITGETCATIERSESSRIRAVSNFVDIENEFKVYTQNISKLNRCIKKVIPNDELAKQYMVCGCRGEAKKINLPIEFVTVEEGLFPKDFLKLSDSGLHEWRLRNRR